MMWEFFPKRFSFDVTSNYVEIVQVWTFLISFYFIFLINIKLVYMYSSYLVSP